MSVQARPYFKRAFYRYRHATRDCYASRNGAARSGKSESSRHAVGSPRRLLRSHQHESRDPNGDGVPRAATPISAPTLYPLERRLSESSPCHPTAQVFSPSVSSTIENPCNPEPASFHHGAGTPPIQEAQRKKRHFCTFHVFPCPSPILLELSPLWRHRTERLDHLGLLSAARKTPTGRSSPQAPRVMPPRKHRKQTLPPATASAHPNQMISGAKTPEAVRDPSVPCSM